MDFDIDAQTTHQRKDSLFNKCCSISTRGRRKLDRYVLSCAKINFTWFNDLGIRHKTLQLKEEETKILYDIGIGKALLNAASVV